MGFRGLVGVGFRLPEWVYNVCLIWFPDNMVTQMNFLNSNPQNTEGKREGL